MATQSTATAEPANEADAPSSLRSTIMVGHSIEFPGDEASVAIYLSGQVALLSIAGSRLLASQISAWADHAEKHNTERGSKTMAQFVYRVLDKGVATWEPLKKDEPTLDAAIEVSSESMPPVKRAEVYVKLRRVKRSRKNSNPHKPRRKK